MRVRRCAAAAVLATAPLVHASAARADAGMPVTACPIPPHDLAGITVRPPPVPANYSLPATVTAPPGSVLFGTGLPGQGVDYTLGPAGSRCQPSYSNADGGFVQQVVTGTGLPVISQVFSAGGAGPNVDLACAYIPAVHAADVAFRGGNYCPPPPATDNVTQIATGDPSYPAALVVLPPGKADPRLPTSGASESTIALFVAHLQSPSAASGQEAECTLPADQVDVCSAGLRLFAAQSQLAASAPALLAVDTALGRIATPTTGRIVVMGDSYASGEGTYNNGSDPNVPSVNYYPATAADGCHRSPAAYAPALGVAAADFVACSGATTSDMINGRDGEPSQLHVLDHSVTTVIISAGGDDVGFPDVLSNCTDIPFFFAHSFTDCQNAVNAARGKISTTMKSLASLYSTIEERTGGAHLIVVGYPQLFPDGGHFGCSWIDEPRQKIINDAGNQFDDAIRSTVGSVPHATFVDTRPLFHGHEVCGATDGAWINDLQTDEGTADNCPSNYLFNQACSQSYHPNVLGYRAIGQLLARLLSSGSGGTQPPASSSPVPAPVKPLTGDCYDINYSGVDSRPMASYCASALGGFGIHATAHTNASGSQALSATPSDAVFYASGHSGSDCPGEWSGDTVVDPNELTGASVVMPGPNDSPTYLTGPRDLGSGTDDNCFQNEDRSSVLSSWATPNEIGHADLVVLQLCASAKPTFTATDGNQLVSLGQEAYDAGAKTVLGFADEIPFEGGYGQHGTDYGTPSPYRPYGDLWAHTFWASMGAGAPASIAAFDATAEESLYSGGDGYQSWVILTHADAPTTLAAMTGKP